MVKSRLFQPGEVLCDFKWYLKEVMVIIHCVQEYVCDKYRDIFMW